MNCIMTITDPEDGCLLATGLQCPCVSDEAAQIAQSMADARGAAVHVSAEGDEEGVIVEPGAGTCRFNSEEVGCCRVSPEWTP